MARHRKMINQINVVPYIDVMLVLLVIFMITAPLMSPGVIDLPSIGQQLTAPVAPLKVTLRADRSLLLEQPPTAPLKVSRDELVARIRDQQAKRADQAVVIAADRSVRYQEVVDLLDLLQRSGIRKVGLLVRTQSS
jgi:biopolymer transport protein TolR